MHDPVFYYVFICFMQGIKGYDFNMYLDIHKLMHGKRDVSHPLVKKFLKNKAPYESLRTYAKYSDATLLRKIQVLCMGIDSCTDLYTFVFLASDL